MAGLAFQEDRCSDRDAGRALERDEAARWAGSGSEWASLVAVSGTCTVVVCWLLTQWPPLREAQAPGTGLSSCRV